MGDVRYDFNELHFPILFQARDSDHTTDKEDKQIMKPLDELIRAAVAKGEFSHLSIVSFYKGGFGAAFHTTTRGNFSATDIDPVKASQKALTAALGRQKKDSADDDFG
jgi:hypothetical protein